MTSATARNCGWVKVKMMLPYSRCAQPSETRAVRRCEGEIAVGVRGYDAFQPGHQIAEHDRRAGHHSAQRVSDASAHGGRVTGELRRPRLPGDASAHCGRVVVCLGEKR